MKKIVLILFLVLHYAVYSITYDTAFVRTFGGKLKDVAYDVKQTSDNGFILVGTTNSYGAGETSIYLVKTDSNGIFKWSKTFDSFNINMAYSVAVNSDKGYSVFGYTNSIGNGGYDTYLIKTDSLGNKLWEKTYGGTDWDFGYSHTQLADSGFVLCGSTYSYTNGNSDAYVIRTNKSGDTLWTRHFGDIGDDIAYSVIVKNDTNYVITGKKNIAAGNDDFLFILLDQKGTTISMKNYGGIKNDFAKNICQTNDNGFALIGTSNSFSTAGDNDMYLIKVDSLGNPAWSQLYGSTGLDEGEDITQIRNGNFDITGVSSGYGLGGTALAVLRVNANGNWLDGAAFGGAKEETGYAICKTNTGGIVYTGYTTSLGQGQEDFYFVKMYNDSVFANYTLQVTPYYDNLLSSITNYTSSANEISVYPNPFSSSTLFVIKDNSINSNTKLSFQLFDIYGRCVVQKIINDSSFELERGDLSTGTYIYSIVTPDKVIKGKIVIN
jgi:hypothetical protein